MILPILPWSSQMKMQESVPLTCLKRESSDSTKSKQNMECLLTFLWILSHVGSRHNKVTSKFSVVNIDGCPLGTVYFVHHNAKLH